MFIPISVFFYISELKKVREIYFLLLNRDHRKRQVRKKVPTRYFSDQNHWLILRSKKQKTYETWIDRLSLVTGFES